MEINPSINRYLAGLDMIFAGVRTIIGAPSSADLMEAHRKSQAAIGNLQKQINSMQDTVQVLEKKATPDVS